MHCVALTLMEHATIRQSYHKKWPFLIPNISHYVQRVSCSISSESAGALCFFWCSVIVLRSMNHLLQYSGLFCCEDLSSWFLQKVDTLILNNTESLWCCYCLHCELQMLHITHYCLWWSTDLSNFEALEQLVSAESWHPDTKQHRVTVMLLLLALWTSNVTHYSLLLVVVHRPVQLWGAETCVTEYLSVKISYKNQCNIIFKWVFHWQKQEVAVVLKVKVFAAVINSITVFWI